MAASNTNESFPDQALGQASDLLPDALLRWGILGPGRIAAAFVRSLKEVAGCVPAAVASRKYLRAHYFAEEHGVEKVFGDYAEMLADPEVDVVYIATPHVFHAQQIRMCLEAGKHVVCEKPITTSAAELQPLIALARERRLFLMEGLWSRFFPAWHQAKSWMADGRIGMPKLLEASFCFLAPWKPEDRLLNPDLAGGALLDVGIYTLAFATWVLGTEVREVRAVQQIGRTGVDEETAMLLRFESGAIATLTCGIRTAAPQSARVEGVAGRLRFPEPFWKPERVVLSTANAEEEFCYAPNPPGFQPEIAHVRDCLRGGLTESPVIPLAESLLWQEIMDAVRGRRDAIFRGTETAE